METTEKITLTIEECFPFPKFRAFQEKILNEVKTSFEDGIEVAIIEGPTGFGKSPVNIALGLYFEPTFYTTPQIKLVNQIAKDFGPKSLAIDGGTGSIIPLLGRKNYICRASNKPSDECYIYNDSEHRCSEEAKCVYWHQKQKAISSDIAIITFAMLIINSYLLSESRFSKRNLLIIDECHSLESQVASLFAGFTISPFSFPSSLRKELWEKTLKIIPKGKDIRIYIPFFEDFRGLIQSYLPLCTTQGERDKLVNFLFKIKYMLFELENGKTWVINLITRKGDKFRGRSRQFKPIFIDSFLRRKVWSQTDKIILSSATIPFRNDIEKWLNILGLGNRRYSFHSIPMQFPLENRPIITSCMGGKMTHQNEDQSWDENIKTIKEIINEHRYERGVIHTQSYHRSTRIANELKGYSIFLHNKEEINNDIIDEWVTSKKLILISPSIKEGVDLKDDLCRFQIVLKIPYPSIGDARVKYLLMQKKQWTWYFNETAKDVIQMYGRAIRSDTDHAKFYIIDGSFEDLSKKAFFPDWFNDAIIT